MFLGQATHSPVLVGVLFALKRHMSTFKHLTGDLLTVSELESMTVMVGGVAAGRQAGGRAVAESSHLIYNLEAERLGPAWAFETSEPDPSGILPSTRLHLLIFPQTLLPTRD